MKILTKNLMFLSAATLLLSACNGMGLIKHEVETQSYYCDNSLPLFTTSYDDDTLDLTYANRTVTLFTQAGGPRQLYSNQAMQWQIKGDSGILYSMKSSGERGGRIDSCKLVPVGAATAPKNPIAGQELPIISAEPRPQPIGNNSANMPETMSLEQN